MHPASITVLQEQARQHQPHADTCATLSTAGTTSTSSSSSFSQRLWRFVRDNVLPARPQRKVRSASYSPETDAQKPRQNKQRAKSCGHEADARASAKEHRTAYVTATAWRKSKMLQELEASTERGRSSCMPTTAVLRDKHSHAHERMPVRSRQRPGAQERCHNCAQLFFASATAEPQQQQEQERQTLAFCSLDCKSTFQYRRQVQCFVNERIDEEDSGDYRSVL